MATIQDLYQVFESFCAFGSNRNLATGSMDSLTGVSMDNQKFNKFAKDTKIIDGKKVTSTDCDILFNKVKAKGARRLDFDGFQVAFQELANKKYPGKNPKDSYDCLLHFVLDKGPIARATVADASGVYDKLTNSQLYTGTHKNRFDENGVGKGATGRQVIDSNTHDLNQLVNRDTNSAIPNNTYSGSTTGVGAPKKRGTNAVVTASSESLEIKSQPSSKKQDNRLSNTSLAQRQQGATRSNQGSLNNLNKATTTKSNSSINKLGSNSTLNKPSTANYSATKSGGASVFDRLTNVNGYTGTHKERFNADGTGRGLGGRDTIAKGAGTVSSYKGGDVNSLSQILRN